MTGRNRRTLLFEAADPLDPWLAVSVSWHRLPAESIVAMTCFALPLAEFAPMPHPAAMRLFGKVCEWLQVAPLDEVAADLRARWGDKPRVPDKNVTIEQLATIALEAGDAEALLADLQQREREWKAMQAEQKIGNVADLPKSESDMAAEEPQAEQTGVAA